MTQLIWCLTRRADDRKDWLGKYSRDDFLDTNQPAITYEDFIKGEMIHFSKYDCDRSILILWMV